MSPPLTPLDGGALAGAVRGGRAHPGHLHRHGHRRSAPRCARPPGSTGCCSTSSTAPAARSRSATWSRPPAATASPPWSASRPPSGSGSDGCWTAAPPGIMLPRLNSAAEVQAALTAPALPAAGRPRRRHLQPGLPVRARPRRAGPGRRRDRSCVVQIESAAAVAAGRRHRRPRRGRRAVRRPPRPQPRPRRPRRHHRPGLRRGPGHGPGRRASATARPAGCSSPTAPPRPPASRRAGRSSPSAPTPPCSPRPSGPSSAEPAPPPPEPARLSTEGRHRHGWTRHRRRLHRAGHRPDQRGLDGQAAQPRLPGHPAGLPGARASGPGWCTPPTPPPTGPTTPRTSSATPRAAPTTATVLADPDVDVVSICAPNLLHREIGIAAAEAGKPFWIEKPVGRDAAETAAVAAAARAAGRRHLDRLQLPPRPGGRAHPRADRERRARPDHQRAGGVLQRLRLRAQRRPVVAVQEGPRRQRRPRRPAQPRRRPRAVRRRPDHRGHRAALDRPPAAPDPADGLGHPLRGDRGRRARRRRERRLRRRSRPVRGGLARVPARSAPWRRPGSSSARSAVSASRSTAPRARRRGTSSR